MQLDKDFEEILIDFFKKYDKRQFRHNKPHKIAVAFKGREDEVMAHLCKKYDVDPKTIAGIDLSSPSQPPSDPEHSESASAQETSTATADEAKGEGSEKKVEGKVEEGVEEAGTSPDEVSAESDEKPKSKKKLVIIILIVLLLAAAGAAGYLFKDKILGIITGTEQETPQENIEEAIPVKNEVEKTEESPEAATDEQASKEADETEEVKEEGNDEEGSDEETSGDEE